MKPEWPQQGRPNHKPDIPAGAEGAARDAASTGGGDGLLRSLLEHSSDIVALLEEDGTIRYVSPAVERVLGYEPEDVFGTRVLCYVHPQDVEDAASALSEVLQDVDDRALKPVELRARVVDGSWRHVEVFRNNRLDDPDVGASSSACGTSRSARRPKSVTATL